MVLNDKSWTEVIRAISPGLLRYFCAQFPRDVAADLVQEVCLRLIVRTNSGSFRQEEGTLRMYAYGIARLVRLEARRSTYRIVPVAEIESLVPIFPDSDPRPYTDERGSLRRAIGRLKPTEQEIILLLIDRELKLEEIAALLALPLGTVKSHVHRAKAHLKRSLEDESQEGR